MRETGCGNGRYLGSFVTALVLLFGMTGCHGDTDQGGGTDRGGATKPAARQQPPSTSMPPTADQVDPSSPRAVLGGTSTTQPATGSGQGQANSPH